MGGGGRDASVKATKQVRENQGSKATSRVGNDLLTSEQRGIKVNLPWQEACGMSLVPGAPVDSTTQGLALARPTGAAWLCLALPSTASTTCSLWPGGTRGSTKAEVSSGWTLTVHAQLRGTAFGAEVTSFLPQKGFWKGWKNTFWPRDCCGISPEKGISFFSFCSAARNRNRYKGSEHTEVCC